jgi:hypothetical protein
MVDEFSSEQKKKFDYIRAKGEEDRAAAPLIKRSNNLFDKILDEGKFDKKTLSKIDICLSDEKTNLPPVRKAASQQIGR